ncbi:MAG: hypothetical protein AMJ73_00070 [candidate division Zixibacteria bacterium SM1_73]|nr:MAG: hypothetical protein AMJ73_00070 [candidate division Zixibacteria bacterium SM1_73]
MISQREVSQIAFRQHKLDRVIEKDYVISWIILGLANSSLKKSLAFKGGTALKKVYFPNYRYSEDIDFTLLEYMEEKALIEEFKAVLRKLEKSQAFLFNLREERIEKHINSLIFFVEFVGPLQATLGGRSIKVDFTLIEKLVFPIEERMIKAPYSDCKNLKRKLKTYSLEEVLIEKLCALISRTEPRDLYDVHHLFNLESLDHNEVAEGFRAKAESKKIDPRRLSHILKRKEATIAKLWEIRLAQQVDELPHLDAVTRKINKCLRQHGMA